MGLKREQVFICNIVKCRATCRTSARIARRPEEETAACTPYLAAAGGDRPAEGDRHAGVAVDAVHAKSKESMTTHARQLARVARDQGDADVAPGVRAAQLHRADTAAKSGTILKKFWSSSACRSPSDRANRTRTTPPVDSASRSGRKFVAGKMENMPLHAASDELCKMPAATTVSASLLPTNASVCGGVSND